MFPGAVTTIFTRQPRLNADLNPGCDLVGIRIPKYPPILQLVDLCSGPLALTSANLSEAQSSLEVEVSGIKTFCFMWKLAMARRTHS